MAKTPAPIRITGAILRQLIADPYIDASDIRVCTDHDTITLQGTVPCRFTRHAAVEITRAVASPRPVDDQLAICYPVAADTPAATRVRSIVESALNLLPDLKIHRPSIRAVNGVVTLEGSVEAKEKKRRVGVAVHLLPGVLELENKLTVVPTGRHLDHEIAERVAAALDQDPLIGVEALTITVAHGTVHIEGLASTGTAKRDALQKVLDIPGVVDIQDGVCVAHAQQSELTQGPPAQPAH